MLAFAIQEDGTRKDRPGIAELFDCAQFQAAVGLHAVAAQGVRAAWNGRSAPVVATRLRWAWNSAALVLKRSSKKFHFTPASWLTERCGLAARLFWPASSRKALLPAHDVSGFDDHDPGDSVATPRNAYRLASSLGL